MESEFVGLDHQRLYFEDFLELSWGWGGEFVGEESPKMGRMGGDQDGHDESDKS